MARDSQKPRTDGELRFDSAEHEVEARTVVRTVDALQTALEEIGRGIEANSATLLKLKPFKPGSFIIPFAICWRKDGGKESLLEDAGEPLEAVLRAVQQYVQAKLFLRGRAARSVEVKGEEAILVNHEGQELRVRAQVLLLLDKAKGETDAKFALAFGQIEQEPAIRAVSVCVADRGPLFRVPRERYADIARAEPVMECVLERKTAKTRETLRIISLSFDPALRWKLETKTGVRITAAIRDKEFFDHLKAREDQFADGDSLEVTLTFAQERTSPEKDWEDVAGTHEVIKVHKHNPMPKTGRLF